MRVLGFSVAVVGLLSAVPALAQDTLTFDNGNILSGRIKRFERGEVTLDIPLHRCRPHARQVQRPEAVQR